MPFFERLPMTRPYFTRVSDSAGPPAQGETFENSPSVNPAERLRRWGALVATGEAPLPQDLQPDEFRTVLLEVARLRRERLVRLVARAIARDLHRDREH